MLSGGDLKKLVARNRFGKDTKYDGENHEGFTMTHYSIFLI